MVGKGRILVVEDAANVADLLRRGLTEEGFEVTVAASGEEALRHADQSWGLVVLDLMLPDLPGENVLDYFAHRLDRPPVLVLTARDQLEDKVALFQRGCDDYLTKPFAFEELLLRVQALLRRAPRVEPEACRYEDMALESATHKLRVGDRQIPLTPKEFAICRLLMREPGRVVSRRELLHGVWGLAHEPRTNFIEVHLTNLRKKLGQADRAEWLRTIRASGFVLNRPHEPQA